MAALELVIPAVEFLCPAMMSLARVAVLPRPKHIATVLIQFSYSKCYNILKSSLNKRRFLCS